MTETLSLLSDDLSINTTLLETSASNIALVQGNMPWGNDMWGSQTIWGAAYTNYYEPGVRFVDNDDFGLNIVRL